MNLTLHLVRKDLVRMRVWIACWVALLLAPIAIGAWLIVHPTFTNREWDLPQQVAILSGVEALVGYLLTILVIQEDGIVGTQQFWLTRPISRGRLLRAKAISVLVIVGLVPIVVSLPWWLWCGFNAGQIAGAAGETLLVLLVFCLPAALVAVLTDSFSRALLWSLAALAGVMFGGFLFTVATRAFSTTTYQEEALLVTRCAVGVIAVALEVALIVMAQFLLRRRGWWLAAAGVAIALTVVAASRWRWAWDSVEPREHHAELAKDVTVQFHRAVASPLPPEKFRHGAKGEMVYQHVAAQLVVTGVPAERELMGAVAKQHWEWPGGLALDRLEPLYSGAGDHTLLGLETGPADPETRRKHAEWLEQRTKRTFAPGESAAQAEAWLPPSFVARMRAEPPKFTARLWWQLIRPELRLEVPLEPGRWVTRDGHGVGIQKLEHRDDMTMITLLATRPVLFTPMVRAMGKWYRRSELDNEQSWALLDREHKRVVYMFGEHSSDHPKWIIINGVKIEWRTHFATAPGRVRDGKWVRDPALNIATSLAVITMHEDAMISRELKVERFEPAN